MLKNVNQCYLLKGVYPQGMQDFIDNDLFYKENHLYLFADAKNDWGYN